MAGVDNSLAGAPRGEGFPPELRIRRGAEYRALRDTAKRVHTKHFVILIRARENHGPTRLGITVTKRVANAVGRNRIKRVVREVFRRQRTLFPESSDVVLIARRGATELDYATASEELAQAKEPMRRAERATAGEGRRARPTGRTRGDRQC